jgi:hypothetical protein
LNLKDLPKNWTSSLEDKTMFISKTLDQSAGSLDQINWKKVFAELSELWIILWKILIISAILTYVSGKALGLWVHRTNDQLAANWVRMLGLTPVMEEEENEEDEAPLPILLSTPAEVEQDPLPCITKEVSVLTTPAVEVEVKLNLPPASTEVVQILVLDEQPPPPARRRRSRNSASNSLEETVNEEVEPPPTRRPRGRRAHAQRNRAAA